MIYEGEYFEGRRQGQGTLRFANGTVFIGFFENDHMASGALSLRYLDTDSGQERVDYFDEVTFTAAATFQDKETDSLPESKTHITRVQYHLTGRKKNGSFVTGIFGNGKMLSGSGGDHAIDQ